MYPILLRRLHRYVWRRSHYTLHINGPRRKPLPTLSDTEQSPTKGGLVGGKGNAHSRISSWVIVLFFLTIASHAFVVYTDIMLCIMPWAYNPYVNRTWRMAYARRSTCLLTPWEWR
eukprot:jgi/Botrbrau1/21462/Bobra.0216s0070.1